MIQFKQLQPKPGIELLAIKVPKDSHSFEVQENPVEGGNHVMMLLGRPDYACVFSVNLPKGNWKIAGLSDELTEEQWKTFVDTVKPFAAKLTYFKEYNNIKSFHITAKKSGLSLLEANGITEIVIILERL